LEGVLQLLHYPKRYLPLLTEDFDQKYFVKDLYEKEKGMLYAYCGKSQQNSHKEAYLAKFIEASSLLEDLDPVL
jgi:hypothetical protein